jgi:hypothetical protein
MKVWVALFKTPRLIDAKVMYQDERPSLSQMLKLGLDLNVDRGDWVHACGPFPLPESIEQLRHDAWSKGWDSLEGALLDQLGIKDEECNGIENVIKDLVNRCKGFKAWRTYHVARRKR